MGLATYAITPVGKKWGILHDGQIEGDYVTKESAFEAAVAAASLAVREGHEVRVTAPGVSRGDAALGVE